MFRAISKVTSVTLLRFSKEIFSNTSCITFASVPLMTATTDFLFLTFVFLLVTNV